jgi:hypothetical protein
LLIRKIVPVGFVTAMALTVAAALPATATTTPPPTKCKLTLTKSVDNPTPAPGSKVTFTIAITATDCVDRFVSIHDDNRPGEQLFPTSLTLVSASPAPSHLDTQHLRWFLTGNGVIAAQATDTLTAPRIQDNPATGTIHIVASVPAAAACDTAIVNTATASSFAGTDEVSASSGVTVPAGRHTPQASGARTVTPTCPTVTPPPSTSTSSSGIPGLPNTGRPAQD